MEKLHGTWCSNVSALAATVGWVAKARSDCVLLDEAQNGVRLSV